MRMLKKNEIIPLEITDITNEGNGVGRYEGIAVFVPDTAVGDVINCRIVKVKSSFCYGRVEGLEQTSPYRCENDCTAGKQCGGCCFRHITYEEECRLKDKFVKDSFARIGKLAPEFLPFVPCEHVSRYRNKAQYPVGEIDGKAVCGFYARRSHRIVDYTSCLLQPEIFENIVNDIINYININKIPAYNELTLKGLLRHICLRRGEHTGEIMVCLVVTDLKKARGLTPLAEQLCKKYSDIKTVVLNENPKNTNVILGEKLMTLRGKGFIEDIMCGNRITISPLSFYQVNTCQAEVLYGIAADFAGLDENTVLLDLYCGTGTIGLSMSRRVKKLIGVEVILQAIENAKSNAEVNGLENTEFICGDAGEIAKTLFERGERPNVIIADPARKGCDRLSLEYMAKMSPERIVMISCNHATAARDCAVLEELGYKTVRAVGVDMFPRTGHVECVIQLFKANEGA